MTRRKSSYPRFWRMGDELEAALIFATRRYLHNLPILDLMTVREREACELYLSGHTYTVTAQKMGVCVERVRQLVARGERRGMKTGVAPPYLRKRR